MKPKLYIIAGATCTGKTAVAIALAKRLSTEIISADSRQCYRDMTIGTAKPNPEELREVKHYFIDEFPITQNLSAADFETLAMGYLVDIFSRHDTAVVCGGTGLYIKALCDGLDPMPSVDDAITNDVEKQFHENGMLWLQIAVKTEDPLFYDIGEIHNPARLMRALSFIRSTGKSIRIYQSQKPKQRYFDTIKIGIDVPRPLLYERINTRVDMMMHNGLLEEVKQLYPHRHFKNLQTVGYTELFDYLDGKYTLDEAVNKIKQHTRNYAKRQITWFKKDKEIQWLSGNPDEIVSKISNNLR